MTSDQPLIAGKYPVRRLPQVGLALLGASVFGCADLIGLNGLDSGMGGADGSSGGLESQASGGQSGTGGGDGGTGGAAAGGAASGGNTGSDGGAPSGGQGGTGPDPACSLDTFDDAAHTASCWSTFNQELLFGGSTDFGYSLDEDSGIITMRPEPNHAWFDGESAFFLYQEITGNFLLEAEFSVWGATTMTPPDVAYADAGLLAFPASEILAEEAPSFLNYYAIKGGTGDWMNPATFKGEYTLDDDYDETEIGPLEAELAWDGASLRMCRVGRVLWTGVRLAGESAWTTLHGGANPNGYDTGGTGLPELTETLHVGLLAELYDDGAFSGDARIVYTRAEFTVPDAVEDCYDP